MPKEGNSSPIKVLMPFTSQQLVFLAGTLKPKGFVPCILAMREDCTLGQSVCGTQTPLGLTLLDLASAEGFFIHENGCSQSDRSDRNFNGNELPTAYSGLQ